MNKVKEEEIVMEASETKVKPDGGIQSKTSDTVRFWSSFDSYKIAVEGRNIKFSNHTLLLNVDSPDIEIVRRTNTPYIHEIADKPFEDEAELARFNSFLGDILFTGERGEPSRSGIMAIQAMFDDRECDDLVVGGKLKADQLIVRAMRKKSFKGGI